MSASSEARRNNSIYLRRKQRVKHDDSTSPVHSRGNSWDESSVLDSHKQLVVGGNDKLDNEQQALDSGQFLESYSIIEFSTGELLVGNKSAFECCSSADDICCSSKSDLEDHEPSLVKIGTDESGECSSTEIGISRSLQKHTWKRRSNKPTLLCGIMDDSSGTNGYQTCRSQPCKVCGILDNVLKMLICDHCEEAFHVSCCKPRVKNTDMDEWYCLSCAKKKPRSLLEVTKLPSASKLISLMLQVKKKPTKGILVGEEHQAEVPEWSGRTADACNYFDQADMEGSNVNDTSQRTATWNWLQCRKVICDNTKDGGSEVICGKWRWAPLSEDQTDNWDCSCAIPWDPAHADCAVPQEISTEEVMKQREYIKQVKLRLAAKKRRLDGGDR